MSVSPNSVPQVPCLLGTEGELVSVSVFVEPRRLEQLLDTLAHMAFPINPQIYHQAAIVRVYPDGRREMLPSTVVEFPAYAGRMSEVHAALAQDGFDEPSVQVRSMLDNLRATPAEEPAPAGAPYRAVIRYKHTGLVS
jgi:hypothetical protein